ncbi:MAG TPA: triose-phosphate isomerase family protein [Patescibacteria group bacterium]|jgi:triosephosphate isomerase|nr:triose-phosphate isomerase family protein [Patescibacteria group bacterium]
MGKCLIVANLKSYQNENEAKNWLETFGKIKELNLDLTQKEIIICPSFTQLFSFFSYFSSNNIKVMLGAQNVSPFDEGAYTGEVNAKQIKDFVQYVLIGHSERRQNFNETEDMLIKKVDMTLKYGLNPIFLVQNQEDVIPQGVQIVAYDPSFAIGSGTPDTPENADAIAAVIKSKNNNAQVLYGGSVTSENVKSFTAKTNLDGVIVGGASLEAEEFIKIIKNA